LLSIPFRKLINPKQFVAARLTSSEDTPTAVDASGLITCHFDTPVLPAHLDRPQLDLRGWIAMSSEIDLDRLTLELKIGDTSRPVSKQIRADVAEIYPDLVTTGFQQLIELQHADLDQLRDNKTPIELVGRLPDATFVRPIDVTVDTRVRERSSYYRRNDHEHRSNLESGVLTAEQQACWEENGYVVVKAFYSNERVEEINQYIDRLWTERQQLDAPVTIDEYIGTDRERRRLFSNASPAVREQPYKVNDLYLASDVIRDIVLNEDIADLLSALLYSGSPMICSSLYFEKGSQQRKHFDTFFMPPLIRDRMLATWIALEDVSETSGPLAYYPGSHRIEPWVFKDGRYNLQIDQRDDCYRYIDAELEQRQIEPEYFLAERGDLFVWHPQLLHGGDRIEDADATRKSLVTHYFCREDHPEKDAEEFADGRFYLKRNYLPATA